MSENGGRRPEVLLGNVIKRFEHGVVVALVVMMVVVVALATIELGWIIFRDITTAPVLLLEVDELLEIFGFFLLILIGVELLETIKAYLRDNVVHVEIVLEVALIAIARKVVALDLAKYDGLTILAIAALVVALATAFLLEKRARQRKYPILSPRSKEKDVEARSGTSNGFGQLRLAAQLGRVVVSRGGCALRCASRSRLGVRDGVLR